MEEFDSNELRGERPAHDEPTGGSLSELVERYTDDLNSRSDRELAFTHYWLIRLHREASFSQADLDRLIRESVQPYVVADVVATLCRREALSLEEVEWIKERLSSTRRDHSFALRQLEALQILRDCRMGWHRQFERLLFLGADWADSRVILSVPTDGLEEVVSLIDRSARPRRARNKLLAKAKERQDAGRPDP